MGRKDRAPPCAEPLPHGFGKAYVRITGTRLGRFVEFDFSVNDADLTVELILPFSAFDEFCALRRATILPPAEKVTKELEQLAWRARQPGLLRRVKSAAEGEAAPGANASKAD